ncbi:hypothetical protein HG536_0A01740 [Torulaspora globosa]|uniref:Uncharacterized protein n=1 Tax=Torulaspora globosa TaxID=48254 RepID=A0A7G3ZA21_9SACH|nr:uncharacterized protein HG536_0A01740 [Torulaspora globosa]QLL30357.1 hypothetical protein HG536_0A01740 [Torulaspora globosa]
MSSSQVSEAKERDLVEKVELRLALADSAEKLEKSLDTFVTPLLLKLASPHASVRQAVFNVLKDVLARLNSLKEVKVPVRKLIEQAQRPAVPPEQDDSNVSNVRLYSLLLASKGIDRLDAEELRLLVPLIMSGISQLPRIAAARMFHILCKTLLRWTPPLKGSKEEDETREFLRLDDEEDLKFLLEKFIQFLLLVPARPDARSGIIPRGYSCPGLSSDDVSFLTYEAGVSFTREQALRFKCAVFKFVNSGFVPEDKLLTKFLLVASADPSEISESAQQGLKRIYIPYEDADFIESIITLYAGDKRRGSPPAKQELQERILRILTRSVLATSKADHVAAIISIGMHSESYKLRALCLIFIRHVAKHNYRSLAGQQENNIGIAPLLRNNLHDEGWPRLQLGQSSSISSASIDRRRLQYETLGDILKRDFDLLLDLSYIEFLLDSLKSDLPEFRASIQEALVSLTPSLHQLPDTTREKLRLLIRKIMMDESEEDAEDDKGKKEGIMACKYVCIKYCNAAFPFNDTKARMLNVWGTWRGNKFDVIEESYKGLNPYWFRKNQALNTTEFKSTADLLATEIRQSPLPSFQEFVCLMLDELDYASDKQSTIMFRTLNVAVSFSKQCLISQAIHDRKTMIVQDEDWSVRIEKALAIDENVRSSVLDLLSRIEDNWLLKFFSRLCAEFTIKNELDNQVSLFTYNDVVFGETLLGLIRFCSRHVLSALLFLIPQLMKYLQSSETNTHENLRIAANTLGIIAASVPESEIVQKILETVEISAVDQRLPSLLAKCYIVPRIALAKRFDYPSNIINTVVGNLSAFLQNSRHKIAAINLLAQMMKYGTLRCLDLKTRCDFLSEVSDILEPNLMKNAETIELWGYLSMYAEDDRTFELQLDRIWETHVSKQVDLLFSAGEALAIMAGGWRSKILHQQLDLSFVPLSWLEVIYCSKRVPMVLDRVLRDCGSTKPSLRRASCIWLLSLVQYLSSEQTLKERSADIHSKFMKFLADRDEFIQESAARGLGLVYEMGDGDLKEEMVKGLLKSFTDNKEAMNMAAGSVSGETELFEEGALNTDGGSVRTYKDILNLASDVGDPSLVYKFMSLSKSSSLWSSKKGVSFGLGAIMSKSSLQNLLLQDRNFALRLIPKLYIYRFDPYTAVARSMNDIWNSLVSDSATVTSHYFDNILREALSGMANKEWRVREASALALLQLVQMQPNKKFAQNLLEIWTLAFRAMDDIKESVREAGTKLTTVLSKILARSINVKDGIKSEDAESILSQLLPFFLGPKGLNNDAEEVQHFAMKTLLELIENSGDAMKPFAINLVYDLTLLFSSIEPQAINYLSLNANNFNVDAKAIDYLRRSGVGKSPLMNAIEKLINESDETLMDGHVAGAIKAAKNAVGLPSKVAVSLVFNLLVKKYSLSLKPLAGKLLKSCITSFEGRNPSVKAAFAVTFGHVFRVTTLDKAVKYSKQLENIYFAGDTDSKVIVATAIESVLKHAPSEFENVASIIMPLLFLASNDADKEVSSHCENIWTEASTQGSGSVMLYLDEILDLLNNHIESNDFSVRKTCGQSISVLCGKVDRSMSEKHIKKLFDITVHSLSGRSWEGKEIILDSLQTLASKFRDHIAKDVQLRERLNEVFYTEISRKNMAYVSNAFFPTGDFIFNFPNERLIKKIIDIAGILLARSSGNGTETDTDEGQSSKRVKADSEISRRSSKQNIEDEVQHIKILKKCSKICKLSEEDGLYPFNLLNFIIEHTTDAFNNKSVLYTWRTQVAAAEIGIELTQHLTTSIVSSDVKQLMLRFWSQLFLYNGTKETIENAQLPTIKFGDILRRRIPDLKQQIDADLRSLGDINPTSRIELELQKIGIY